MLSIRCTVVVEQFIVGADLGIDHIHVLLNDSRELVILLVAGLTGLEEDIRVLCGSHFLRVLRVQSVLLEFLQRILINHILQLIIVPYLNLLKLMRCTETVEEIDDRKAAGQCCRMSYRREIHNFLYGRLAEHSCTRLAACINIGMISEDVQCMGSYTSGRYIKYCRKLLTSNLVDVRDHQEKSLRSSIRCGQSTCCDGAVNGTCRTCLRLHLCNLDFLSEQILSSLGSPLIGVLSHRRRRCDRVNSCHFGKRIRSMSCGCVTIHGFHFSCHVTCSSFEFICNASAFADIGVPE